MTQHPRRTVKVYLKDLAETLNRVLAPGGLRLHLSHRVRMSDAYGGYKQYLRQKALLEREADRWDGS